MGDTDRLSLFKQAYPTVTDPKLTWPDIVVVAIYFFAVISVGMFAMYRSSRGTMSGYFLAGRSMWFLPVSTVHTSEPRCSSVTSELSILLVCRGQVQPAASVSAPGSSTPYYCYSCSDGVFIPVYIACGTYTMPEYLSKRFGGQRLRVYFAVLSLILYIFTKCSGDLYTGALFIQQSLRWDLYLCIFIMVMIAGVLTITGGLTAVIYTDTLQATLMVAGGLWLMALSFQEVGGYGGMVEQYSVAMTNESFRLPNETCHEPDKQSFRMLRDLDDDYMPWLGFLLGQTPGSIWYWCADQVIVQRLLAAKSLSHAKGATLMAGFIKILPLFMMVMPGMISRIKFADEVACVDPEICNYVCQSEAGCSNIAYPRLVLGIMPEGLRGLMMAVMVAALMSDLDSIFNSASTLFTIDIYSRIRKRASVKEQMVVGRIFIIVMIGIAIAWVPVVKETQGGQVFIYIQEITDYLAPPFAAVYLLAVLVPFVNEKGAFWSLMVALLTGIVRMVIVFIYHSSGGCGTEDNRPDVLKKFHYMYFSMLITGMTIVLALVISVMTTDKGEIRAIISSVRNNKPYSKFLYRTTFWTRYQRSDDFDRGMFDGNDQKMTDIGKENPTFTGDNSQPEQLTTTPEVFTVDAGTGGKHVFRDPGFKDSNELEENECGRRTINYICGFNNKKQDQEQKLTMQKHLEKVAQLKQHPVARLCLNIGMVIILLLGTFLYIFWSLWRYEPEDVRIEFTNQTI
ncbi:hypothetical protein ScPMuIL_008091 [Solemya velum]